MDRGNPARTGEMPGPGPVGEPVERWRFEVGEDIVSPAIVVNGVVYVAGTFEPLCAIDAASGQEQWRFIGSGPIRGVPSTADFNGRTPSYADGLIVACGISTAKDHALVYAVDAASGQERWRFATIGDDIVVPLTVADGIVYVVDRDTGAPISCLFGLDAATGRERWRFKANSDMYAAPALAGGILYIGSSAGDFYALDAASGRERWRFQTRNPFVDNWYTHFSEAAVAEGRVFVSSSSNGILFALDAVSGLEEWRMVGVLAMPPAVADGVVYGIGSDKSLWARDMATGNELWQIPSTDPGDELVTPPVVADGIIYINTRLGTVSAIDAASGQERWRSQIDEQFLTASPMVSDGIVYLSGYSGWLYAITGADTPAPGDQPC